MFQSKRLTVLKSYWIGLVRESQSAEPEFITASIKHLGKHSWVSLRFQRVDGSAIDVSKGGRVVHEQMFPREGGWTVAEWSKEWTLGLS